MTPPAQPGHPGARPHLPGVRLPAHLLLVFGCALLGLLAHTSPARAQALGWEVFTITNHVQTVRDAPPKEYVRRMDERGQNVVTPGLGLYYDFRLETPQWVFTEIRPAFGIMQDSIAHWSGFVGVMWRWVMYGDEDFEASLQIGPGLIFRETWRRVPGYNPDNPFDESDHFMPGYEYKFLPIGDVDLLWRLSPRTQFVWSIVPGIPYVIVHSLGLRHAM